MYWIMNVFWPCHMNQTGYVISILIIYICTDHDIDMSYLPGKFTVKYLPLNVTNNHQLENMVMTSSL